MQISPNSPLYQILSSATGAATATTAATRPQAAARQDAQAATPAPAGKPRQAQPVMSSSDSAKPRVLPRGSLVNIVT